MSEAEANTYNTRTRKRTHTHAHAHTHTLSRVHVHPHSQPQPQPHPHPHPHPLPQQHPHPHNYTHTCIHVCIYFKHGSSVIMIHYPRAAACFRHRRAKEFKKSSSSRRTQHDPLPQGSSMFFYPSADGRVEGWQHHNEPSHNYKMTAKSVIIIHYPRAVACFIYQRAKEFKKISSSRRAQHDPLLQGCSMYVYLSAGGRVK